MWRPATRVRMSVALSAPFSYSFVRSRGRVDIHSPLLDLEASDAARGSAFASWRSFGGSCLDAPGTARERLVDRRVRREVRDVLVEHAPRRCAGPTSPMSRARMTAPSGSWTYSPSGPTRLLAVGSAAVSSAAPLAAHHERRSPHARASERARPHRRARRSRRRRDTHCASASAGISARSSPGRASHRPACGRRGRTPSRATATSPRRPRVSVCPAVRRAGSSHTPSNAGPRVDTSSARACTTGVRRTARGCRRRSRRSPRRRRPPVTSRPSAASAERVAADAAAQVGDRCHPGAPEPRGVHARRPTAGSPARAPPRVNSIRSANSPNFDERASQPRLAQHGRRPGRGSGPAERSARDGARDIRRGVVRGHLVEQSQPLGGQQGHQLRLVHRPIGRLPSQNEGVWGVGCEESAIRGRAAPKVLHFGKGGGGSGAADAR